MAFQTANQIINRAAVEVGLNSTTDPVASEDESFIQLEELLNACGQELVEYHPWQQLKQSNSFTTTAADSGSYDLPPDYSYMIDQTHWDRTNQVPLGGPLSDQNWTYLQGRDLVSQSIYASFRIERGKMDLYPQPPPTGLEISYEYMSRWWLEGQNQSRFDTIQTGSDFVLYEPIMVVKFLKVKWLDAKGFDSTAARMDFENMFNSRTGKDTGAPILNAANNGRSFPYLHPYYNTSDTGYGIP